MKRLAFAQLAPKPAIVTATPAQADAALAAEFDRLRKKYRSWMTANDVATEESVSVDTARRRLLSGVCGTIDRQPGGGLRILTETYITHLRNRTIVFTATA